MFKYEILQKKNTGRKKRWKQIEENKNFAIYFENTEFPDKVMMVYCVTKLEQ